MTLYVVFISVYLHRAMPIQRASVVPRDWPPVKTGSGPGHDHPAVHTMNGATVQIQIQIQYMFMCRSSTGPRPGRPRPQN
jgi:hypothetical protein